MKNYSDIPSADLDLRGVHCPMAFVKSRIFLDQQPHQHVVSLVFECSRENQTLVRSIQSLGHRISDYYQIPPADDVAKLSHTQEMPSSNANTEVIWINVQVNHKDILNH